MKGPLRAPFFREETTLPVIMKDLMLAMIFLLILPTIRYGGRVILIAITAVLSCLLAEVFCCLLAKREISTDDLSPILIGLMIALLMPASTPWWLPTVASLFAVCVARFPFGGTGHTPFHPVAAGMAFVTIGWSSVLYRYPVPSSTEKLPLFGDGGVVATLGSPSAMLKNGLKPEILPFDMLWGQFAGPIGATGILVICACALYLFVKRSVDWRAPICFLMAVTLYAALFPRIQCSALTSVKYELMTGSLLFYSVFLLSEGSPCSRVGKWIFGGLAGLLTMLFRYYGAYEQGACFAVLIANVLSPMIDNVLCMVEIRREKHSEEKDEREKSPA